MYVPVRPPPTAYPAPRPLWAHWRQLDAAHRFIKLLMADLNLVQRARQVERLVHLLEVALCAVLPQLLTLAPLILHVCRNLLPQRLANQVQIAMGLTLLCQLCL